jgi:hypothetical protein
VYVVLRWSMRSMPHVAFVCVAFREIVWFCST